MSIATRLKYVEDGFQKLSSKMLDVESKVTQIDRKLGEQSNAHAHLEGAMSAQFMAQNTLLADASKDRAQQTVKIDQILTTLAVESGKDLGANATLDKIRKSVLLTLAALTVFGSAFAFLLSHHIL